MFFHKKIIGIMASGSDGVIAKKNTLPWNYPEDLSYFRQKTKGHVIIMGRKTFETIPHELFSERTAIVFSRRSGLESANVQVLCSVEDFLRLSKSFHTQKIFLIGGAEIAHAFLSENLISEFFLTKIHKSYQGDTYLDLNFFEGWNEEVITSKENYTLFKLQNPRAKREL